jgi:hypothetical protein
MSNSFEEKHHSFSQYLRDRQSQYYPMEMLEDIPDENILESYRRDFMDGSYHYTKEQEKSIIMECDSNESMLRAFEKLQHLKHSEELEGKLIEEFKSNINPIDVTKCLGLNNILSKLNKIGIKIEIKDLNTLVINAASIFPHWILSGNTFYVREDTPNNFSMDSDNYCSICLLEETLHKLKTMLGWCSYTISGNFDMEEKYPEVFRTKIVNFVHTSISELVSDGCSKKCSNKCNICSSNKLENLLDKLFEEIMLYIMDLTLISCWVHGKEKALEEEKKEDESNDVLKQTHEYFCEKYKDCKKSGDMERFFVYLNNFLKPLSLHQLSILYREGFPLDLDSRTLKKVDKVIEKYMNIKVENDEI